MPKKSPSAGRNGATLPAWWESRRAEARRRFEELPMPQRKDEDWRFATIDAIRLNDFKPGAKGKTPEAKLLARSQPPFARLFLSPDRSGSASRSAMSRRRSASGGRVSGWSAVVRPTVTSSSSVIDLSPFRADVSCQAWVAMNTRCASRTAGVALSRLYTT